MPTTQEAKFSCAACSREYRWKPELAGKQAKCKCGAAIKVPATPPARPAPKPQDDMDLDGLYSLAAEEEKAAKQTSGGPAVAGYRCPSCGAGLEIGATMCAACGTDLRTGKRASRKSGTSGAAAAAVGFSPAAPAAGIGLGAGVGVLPYGGGMSDAAALKAKRDRENIYEGGKGISLYLPLALIGVGIAFYFFALLLSHNKVGAGLMIFFVGVRVVLNSLLMLAVMLLTVKMLDTGYGAFGPAMLKIIAIAIGPGALGALVALALPKNVGWAVGLGVSIVLYFVLIQLLFRLDLGETILLSAMICAAQWMATVVLGFIIAALIASGGSTGAKIGGGAAAVAIGAIASDETAIKNDAPRLPTPEELAAEIDDLAQNRLNFVSGGDDASYFKEREDYMFSGLDNKQSQELVADLKAMGCNEVRVVSVMDGPDKHLVHSIVIELPKEPAGRKKVFDWRAAFMKKSGMTEEILGDHKPYRDVGQKLMEFDFPSPNVRLKVGAGGKVVAEEADDEDEDAPAKPDATSAPPKPAAKASPEADDADGDAGASPAPAPAAPGAGAKPATEKPAPF